MKVALTAGIVLWTWNAAAQTGAFAPDNPWFQHFEQACRDGDTVSEQCRPAVLGAYREVAGQEQVSCDYQAFWRWRDEHGGQMLAVLPWQYGVLAGVEKEGVCRVENATSPRRDR